MNPSSPCHLHLPCVSTSKPPPNTIPTTDGNCGLRPPVSVCGLPKTKRCRNPKSLLQLSLGPATKRSGLHGATTSAAGRANLAVQRNQSGERDAVSRKLESSYGEALYNLVCNCFPWNCQLHDPQTNLSIQLARPKG